MAGLLAGMLATSAAVQAFSAGATFKVATYSSPVPVDASGRGWLGLTFSSAGVLHAIASDGNLYVASASGPAPVTMIAVGAVSAGANGLAFGLDGKLYAATTAGVLEIDPATGATIRVVAAGLPGPAGLAIDPTTGDLFVTSNQFVYWIADPASVTATAVIYTSLRLGGPTVSHGISINPDGTLYVSTDTQVWRVANPHALPAGITVPSPEAIVSGVNLWGIAVVTNNLDTVARFVYTNTTDGTITRYPVPPAGGTPASVVTGGARGSFMTIGPDRCVYAAQGGAILRVSRDDGSAYGTCDLAAPTTPPASLDLVWTTGSPARVGAQQTFDVSAVNAVLTDGTSVVFTVTGANPQIVTVPASSGHAVLGYAATVAGTDHITATANIGGALTSNTVDVLWGPAFDPIPPVITYQVSGDHGVGFQCVVSTTLDNTDSCGYYTSAPTVTWTVVPGGTAPVDSTHPCLPFTLTASTGPDGIPVTCRASNTDGSTSSRTVILQALLTPPRISAAMTTPDGQYAGAPTKRDVTVTFSCSDDGGPLSIQSCSAPLTVSAEGAGQAVTGTVVDKAGRSVNAAFGPINIDKTAPTISVAATLPGARPYVFGAWTNQPVTLTYACADGAGPLVSGLATCPPTTVVTSRQIGFSASATDVAGNSGSVLVGDINIDTTPPTIAASATVNGVAYNGTAPTNGDVLVTFPCSSDGAPVTCPPAQTFSAAGTFTAIATLTDGAGNSASTSFGPFTIDRTPPTIAVMATTADGHAYHFGDWTSQNVTLTFTCTDGSGVGFCPPPMTVSSTQAATTATATDVAGNTASVPVGAINIDKTPPTITASAMAGGVAYTGVTPTNRTVVVSFTCGTDGAPVVDCPVPLTVSGEGQFSVTRGAIDAAGNAALPVTFGPFTIDLTPPTISVRATLPGDIPYVFDTWTNQNVTLEFTCADSAGLMPSGVASCPPTTVVSATQSGFDATVTDAAGNTATAPVGAIRIDKTPPTITAVVTPAADANGNYTFHATVTLSASDTVGLASITYSAAGAQSIASVTVPATGLTLSVPIALTAAGTTTVTYSTKDLAGNQSAGAPVQLTIVYTQVSALTITSPAVLAQGSTVVTATLLGPGGIPVVGRTVTFTAGSVTGSGITDASGVVSANLALGPGQYSVAAAFAGDSGFYPSTAGVQALTVAGATQFVIWGGNVGAVATGQRVIFWGEHWWDQVNLAEKSKVKDFKGWAATVNGATWATKPGNSKPPQAIPTYISVLITTTVERATGDAKGIVGNVVGHAILRVDSPYRDDPGKPVYGVVVALLP